MNSNSIKNIIIDAFKEICVKYAFQKKTSKKLWEGYYEIVFVNNTTGLEIHYDVREARLDVDIYKLVNGVIVHNPDFGEWFKTQLTGLDLNYILLYYNSELCIPSLYKFPSDSIYNSIDNNELFKKELLQNKKVNVIIISKPVTIFLTQSKEFMSLTLFFKDGHYDDSQILIAYDNNAKKWALSLWKFYVGEKYNER